MSVVDNLEQHFVKGVSMLKENKLNSQECLIAY